MSASPRHGIESAPAGVAAPYSDGPIRTCAMACGAVAVAWAVRAGIAQAPGTVHYLETRPGEPAAGSSQRTDSRHGRRILYALFYAQRTQLLERRTPPHSHARKRHIPGTSRKLTLSNHLSHNDLLE